MYKAVAHELAPELAPILWFDWIGDGEEPSQDALIEWFKVNRPTQAGEVEREIEALHNVRDPLMREQGDNEAAPASTDA